ncbi:Bcr/CflA family efflux MFS transporter [Rhodobacteraceae bacterium RKSG542]|uniref:multidrug effflux MFS transporter n=1 Tax=Pseudovibrio flavus TaxID=2529854 RepID=UPI0012BC8915|nr:multidrug effflux MFS transporter [Pseudovibrio flavus]MTI18348.1 Bcr/CflA family efflux MFS transporter [Pseudovibrio flavus]
MQTPILSEKKTAVICALLGALGPMSMALYTPSMPLLASVFGTDVPTIQMSISLFFAGFTVSQLVCGPLSDAYGRRKVIMWFMGIYLIGSLLAVTTPVIEGLLVARVLQGVGASAGVAISRALVRDQFSGEVGARIMNLVGMMFAVAPACAPLVGSVLLATFGWKAIFTLMVLYGLLVLYIAVRILPETNANRDPSRFRPKYLFCSYKTLISSPEFLLPSLIIALSLGGIYTFPVLLPYVYIEHLGLTPFMFSLMMMVQNVFFFSGALTTRQLMKRMSSEAVVPIGLVCGAISGLSLVWACYFAELTVWHVVLSCGLFSFGVALVMPAMTMRALHPFPHIAGAASALMGFVQMGGGFLAGTVAALAFSSSITALGTILPLLCFGAVCLYWLGLKPYSRRMEAAETSAL